MRGKLIDGDVGKEEPSWLYWEATYEIVLALVEAYPDRDLDSLGLDELYRIVIALPNFGDDPALANEGILIDILREWYEEVNT